MMASQLKTKPAFYRSQIAVFPNNKCPVESLSSEKRFYA
jgi:hypothetical protein